MVLPSPSAQHVWPIRRWPYASAFSLVAVPARMGVWTSEEFRRHLHRGPSSPLSVGWMEVALPHIARVLHLRSEQLHLAADLRLWYPPAVRQALRHTDRTRFDRLRFCEMCLWYGYHCPLFQLPWWFGCPVHSGPLREGCSKCCHELPCALGGAAPDEMLQCPHCGWDFSNPGAIAGIFDVGNPLIVPARWHAVVAAYRHWMTAVSDQFVLPLDVVSWDGCERDHLDGVVQAAIAHANSGIDIPEVLQPHLVSESQPGSRAVLWCREEAIIGKANRHRATLGFSSKATLLKAWRRYNCALPLTDAAFIALHQASRRLRRHLRVRLVGQGTTRERLSRHHDHYDWDGKGSHPKEIAAFRLLTGLVRVERVHGHPYLDFNEEGFLRQPAQALAQRVLSARFGIDMAVLRKGFTVPMFHEASAARVPTAIWDWLYERLTLQAWSDLVDECFVRLHRGGALGYREGYVMIPGRKTPMKVEVPVVTPPAEVAPSSRATPHCLHAEAVRRNAPRSWAMAIVRTASGHAAVLGRSQPLAFAEAMYAQWSFHWRLPEMIRQFDTSRARAL